jgi:hypothetical protein
MLVNLDSCPDGQHHLQQLDLRQLLKHLAGSVAQPYLEAQLPQSCPRHLSEKAEQDVDLHLLLLLMPYGRRSRSYF